MPSPRSFILRMLPPVRREVADDPWTLGGSRWAAESLDQFSSTLLEQLPEDGPVAPGFVFTVTPQRHICLMG